MSHEASPKHITQQPKPDSANANAYARSVTELHETGENSEDEVTHATHSAVVGNSSICAHAFHAVHAVADSALAMSRDAARLHVRMVSLPPGAFIAQNQRNSAGPVRVSYIRPIHHSPQ
jgi:hypothetical protein